MMPKSFPLIPIRLLLERSDVSKISPWLSAPVTRLEKGRKLAIFLFLDQVSSGNPTLVVSFPRNPYLVT